MTIKEQKNALFSKDNTNYTENDTSENQDDLNDAIFWKSEELNAVINWTIEKW